jgi:hypothetical protein
LTGALAKPALQRNGRGDYAATWINDHVLKPRAEELYRGLLKNHLKPAFGGVDLGDIREGDIRRWRKERLTAGSPPVISRGLSGQPALLAVRDVV